MIHRPNKPIPPDGINENTIFKKIKSSGGRLGRYFIERVLLLYFAYRSPKTPKWAKRIILGTLVYFVWPLDTIPDFLPLGYTDDWLTLGAALGAISLYIDEEVKQKTGTLLAKWFP